MKTEFKTLRELNVQPGDVVQYGSGSCYTVAKGNQLVHPSGKVEEYPYWGTCSNFCIISRAPCDEAPKLWRNMTDAEKGAILLARFRGKVIEGKSLYMPDDWRVTILVGFDDVAYRIRPEIE